ncbi:MAG: copper homeostasis protein CutC [Microbacterium sp.]
MVAFELAVQDLEGVDIAARVGADRIELCAALAVGGLTPSLGFIEAAAAGVPVHVLVRPRPGGFEHTSDEVALIARDVRHALAAGATGVVVGGTKDGVVDIDFVRAMTDAAGGAPVTFHRAFDTIDDRVSALDVLADLGVTRVLTSGGRSSAIDARDELTRLARHADGRIEIMAGGGITDQTAGLLLETGVDAIHASAKRLASSTGIRLGSAGESVRETTDEAHAQRIRDLVR